MTPDHRPYLRAGDLRTPEDVLAWLARPRCCKTLEGHVARLRARLDRERRQACRRGALDAWRGLMHVLDWLGVRRGGRLRLRRRPLRLLPTHSLQYRAASWHTAADLVCLALAFRAAARAR